MSVKLPTTMFVDYAKSHAICGKKGLRMEKLEAEINYILYRLQALGEEPDRIQAYKERINQYLKDI